MPKKFVDNYDYEAAIAHNLTLPVPTVLAEWDPPLHGYKHPGTLQFWCPYCDKYHYHGAEVQRTDTGTHFIPRYAGHRVSHCLTLDSPFANHGYHLLVVGEVGTLPKPDKATRAKPYRLSSGVYGNGPFLSGYLRKQRRALAGAESRS